MMSVDILPTALSRESSVHFSSVLMPYLRTLVKEYKFGRMHASLRTGEDAGRLQALDKAMVAANGELKEDHLWLDGPLGVWREQQAGVSKSAASALLPKKKVLVLGSGMVAGPAIDEIASHSDTQLLVGGCSIHDCLGIPAC